VITPRSTRLVRVPDLFAFRAALVDLACDGTPFDARRRLIVVPTHAAAEHLLRSIERRMLADADAVVLPDFVTSGELIARLGERLEGEPRLLAETEREVLAGAACRAAIEAGNEPPFHLRPGLIAEVVRFYDSLQRHQKGIDTFERLSLGALEPGVLEDRGAERLVRQTHFLVSAFRHFEQLVGATGRMDEHGLRRRLLATPASDPWEHIVLAVGDAASDRHGLCSADWDLLSRLPGLKRLDIVATDAVVAGAFHERVRRLLPELEEVRIAADDRRAPPVLIPGQGGGTTWTARDREEEVAGFARWVREMQRKSADGLRTLDRIALVVYRPLPYVYLARQVLQSARVPYQMFDALPLASEPYAAALDLVITCVTTNFGRSPLVALLRSPHFRFGPEDAALSPRELSACDRDLSEAGYLGEMDALNRLIAGWRESPRPPRGLRAATVMAEVASELQPLRSLAPCGSHLDQLLAFLRRYERVPRAGDPLRPRQMRGRGAIFDALTSLRDAYTQFDALPIDFDAVAAVIRRWIESHTFAPRTGDGGVHLVDADSARFGDFDAVQLAGLVDGEWPDTPRRNIFYPPALLRELGWPSESERLDGVRAAFNDLRRLPASRLVVSTFTLEDDAIVAASTLIDAVPTAGVPLHGAHAPTTAPRIFDYEALALEPVAIGALDPIARAAAARRIEAVRGRRSGMTTGHDAVAHSLSALERYQDCPFKFFAADVMKLEEPPEDQPTLSPRARGRFVHEVFQRFFEAWDARGHGTIDVDHIDEARALFEEVAEPVLARFSGAEALLERARLFGSAISVGIVDVVLGLEASRPTAVRERWLEYRLEGEVSLGASEGPRVSLRGVADRIDLMDGNRLRVIDYKSGYPPNPKRALQTPIYALCAQERLEQRDARPWQIDEAAYVAFAGKRPLVPVVRAGGDPDVLASARDRVVGLIVGKKGGEFPARPGGLRFCRVCALP
jgi:hypothetical protein